MIISQSRPNLFIEAAVILTGISIWVYTNMSNIPIFLNSIDSDDLSALISYRKECPFTLEGNLNGLFVHSIRDAKHLEISDSLLKSRFETIAELSIDPAIVGTFLSRQFSMSHVFSEVLLNNKFLLTFFATVLIVLVIDTCITGRLTQNVKDIRRLEEICLLDSVTTFKFLQYFVTERILVIAFVIAQNFADISDSQPTFKDFASFVSAKLSQLSTPVDSTIFAIWFCIIAGIVVIVQSINLRFEKMIEFGENLQLDLKDIRIGAFFVTNFCLFTFTSFTYGVALLSVHFLHPLYSLILFFDAARCWLTVTYMVLRIGVMFTEAQLAIQGENQLDATCRTFLVRGGRYSHYMTGLKMFYDVLVHAFCLAQYITFMYIGLLFNGKLAVVLFSRHFVYHLRKIFTSCNWNEISLAELH